MKSYQQLGFEFREKEETSRRVPRIEVSLVREVPCPSETLSSSEAVAKSEIVERELKHCDREKFICLHLNTKNRLISYEVVSIGSINVSIVHPREVFKGALLSNATSVIFLHNHPSGDPNPSQEDKLLTERLSQAGKILGIAVLDHLIIAGEAYFSFSEMGLI
jgi:DNA repair protein RadC